MRPLKIVFICSSYWEENRRHGGEEGEGGGTQQLAEAVAELGHEVIVLTHSPKVGKLKKAQVGKLETWLSPWNKPRSFFTGLRDRLAKKTYSHRKVYSDAHDLREVLTQRGPFDVIWAHSEAPDALVATVAAKLGGKLPPLLVQVQGLRYHLLKGEPVFTQKPLLSLVFRRATRLLLHSELMAKALAQYAGPGLKAADLQAKSHLVHPNLQRGFLREAEENSPEPASMNERVLFLGAINKAKGATVFMKALPKTEAAQRNATFVLIGDFTDDNKRFIKRWEDAQEEVRIRLPGARMEYLGRVSSYEVIRQIKLAQIVVIPSLFDSYARGLVEALILGRPVITTDRAGAWPLVRTYGCGLVVPSNNPLALAQAIDTMLADTTPYLVNAKHLAHRLLHEYSPQAIALQIAHHLSEIAG
jgi:glycosyltransferase involved in cell wall biosynthesis